MGRSRLQNHRAPIAVAANANQKSDTEREREKEREREREREVGARFLGNNFFGRQALVERVCRPR